LLPELFPITQRVNPMIWFYSALASESAQVDSPLSNLEMRVMGVTISVSSRSLPLNAFPSTCPADSSCVNRHPAALLKGAWPCWTCCYKTTQYWGNPCWATLMVLLGSGTQERVAGGAAAANHKTDTSTLEKAESADRYSTWSNAMTDGSHLFE